MKKYHLYKYCHVKQKVVPIEEIERRAESFARDLFIQDEMEPTRNPLNPKQIFTSKSKLRAEYQAHGAVEVGDAYDRGYIPDRESGASSQRLVNKMKEQIGERLKYER